MSNYNFNGYVLVQEIASAKRLVEDVSTRLPLIFETRAKAVEYRDKYDSHIRGKVTVSAVRDLPKLLLERLQ